MRVIPFYIALSIIGLLSKGMVRLTTIILFIKIFSHNHNYCDITTCWWLHNTYIFYLLYAFATIPIMVAIRNLERR